MSAHILYFINNMPVGMVNPRNEHKHRLPELIVAAENIGIDTTNLTKQQILVAMHVWYEANRDDIAKAMRELFD